MPYTNPVAAPGPSGFIEASEEPGGPGGTPADFGAMMETAGPGQAEGLSPASNKLAAAKEVLAVLREWGVDPTDERLNPNGSGISLGHPVGATGARILATAAREAQRRDARYVLETMCIGGGQGLAAVFETVR